uniref:Uncharacterized protein n=1 Tax=Dulem virus 42 TaxID=3145760 RepID=A0AAU8B9K1_9CAUD
MDTLDHPTESPNSLESIPLGIKFDVTVPEDSGIASYQIVRCSKSSEYTKNLMQCALSRPERQQYSTDNSGTDLKSPWYPLPFLCSQFIESVSYILPDNVNAYKEAMTLNDDNTSLFQLHSPEINLYPEDSLQALNKHDAVLNGVQFAYEAQDIYTLSYPLSGF